MGVFSFHRHLFQVIHEIMGRGVSLYGYGRNGKEDEAFFHAIGVQVHHIYDQNSKLTNIKSIGGGIKS